MISRKTLYFTAPHEVQVKEESLPRPKEDEVLVQTQYSGISAGTELLVYEGHAPQNLAADDALDSLSGSLSYPVKYGYSAVGTVTELGSHVQEEWLGAKVFSFQPHTSHFTATPDALVRLPDALDTQSAVMLPNMETAVNLVLDASPRIGERACVFGQGIVGLLTTALLSQFPLGHLLTVEPNELRRQRSLQLGAQAAVAAWDSTKRTRTGETTSGGIRQTDTGTQDADLAFEVTGVPAVLNDAISCVGYDGRVIVGSWYGTKQAPLDLGGSFHRGRKKIISSQVSTIAPSLQGRWSKARRIKEGIRWIERIDTQSLITDTFSHDNANEAYKNLSDGSNNNLQVVLKYN